MKPILAIVSKIGLSIAPVLVLCLAPLNNRAQSNFETAWKELQTATGFEHAILGACVLDSETGELVFGRGHQNSMLTASTMKAVITRAALDLLGPNYRFQTPVGFEGSLARMDADGWSIAGDLVVQGGGDPTTASRYFSLPHPADEIVRMLRDRQIKQISGNLVVDEQRFYGSATASSTAIGDAGNYYGAGIHAFNYADNTVTLTLRSKAVGEPVEVVAAVPNASGIVYLSKAVGANGGGDQAYVHSGPYQINPIVYGSIPANEASFDIRAAMAHPALEFLHALAKRLSSAGIRFEGELVVRSAQPSAEGENKQPFNLLEALQSPALSEIVKLTNRDSNNLFAGGLFRALDQTGRSDFTGAQDALLLWMKSKGIPVGGFSCADGSGLSRLNRATPFQLASAMRTDANAAVEAVFAASLKPLSGQTDIFVKSGYIQGVRSYAGRATLANGRRVSFAVVVNHYDCSPSRARKLLQEWMAYIPKP